MSPQASSINQRPAGYGNILTPESGAVRPTLGRLWCADNGVFSGKFDWCRFSVWLVKMAQYADRCVFVAAPDVLIRRQNSVVGDAVATLDRFRWFGWRIRAFGYRVALVAQDGLESLRWPPASAYDALFIGGSTDWKLSTAADWCIRRAKVSGKWVHVGRVNSLRRMRHFALVGVDSVDGTALTFQPSRYHKLFTKALYQPILMEVDA